jgi:hypothetical protein
VIGEQYEKIVKNQLRKPQLEIINPLFLASRGIAKVSWSRQQEVDWHDL